MLQARTNQSLSLALTGPAPGRPTLVGSARSAVTGTRPAGLSVRALGRSVVEVGGRALGPEDWTYAKPRELLFHLLARPGSTKGEIGLALWPDESGAELRNSNTPL